MDKIRNWPVPIKALTLMVFLTSICLMSISIFSIQQMHTNHIKQLRLVNQQQTYWEIKSVYMKAHYYFILTLETKDSRFKTLYHEEEKRCQELIKGGLTKKFTISSGSTGSNLFYIDSIYEEIIEQENSLLTSINANSIQNAASIELFGDNSNYKDLHQSLLYHLEKEFITTSSLYSFRETIKELCYYNDILRLIISIALIKGNQEYVELYNVIEGELSRTINKMNQFTYWITPEHVDEIEETHINIVFMERHALIRSRYTDQNDAYYLLYSDEYKAVLNKNKVLLSELEEQLAMEYEGQRSSERNRVILELCGLCVIVILLLFTWSFVLRSSLKWHKKLNSYNKKLKEFNRNLEKRVAKTTEKIYRQTITDDITGLPNGVQLKSELDKNKWQTTILLNIDDFTNIKGAFGPETAVIVLKKLSRRIQSVCSEDCTLFKLSSDEFVLLCRNNISCKNLIKEVEHASNNPPIRIQGIPMHVSYGIGIVVDEKENNLGKANLAMLKSKRKGPGSVSFYKKSLDAAASYKQNIKWVKIVHTALLNGDIVPFYQGIMNNATQTIDRFECLVRLKGKNSYIAPHHFIKPAQKAGLLPKITRTMIRKCFAYFKDNNFLFSINIGSEDLRDSKFIRFLKTQINETKIDPRRVSFEILESSSYDNPRSFYIHLKTLQEIGFKIAIDDFGSAYSNFARVVEQQIDYIKIDGSFIRNIHKDVNSYEVAKSITDFAHNIHAKVIAEYVHNEEVQKVIQSIGIDFSQGYYFSKPKKSILF
ncbi:MAG: GGDEF domain-containing protein [Spirochaetales bacterium]|nr:GGDEF domain-containing protein [Spirochaetales bacterium]